MLIHEGVAARSRDNAFSISAAEILVPRCTLKNHLFNVAVADELGITVTPAQYPIFTLLLRPCITLTLA